MERYSRQTILKHVGIEGQKKLSNASVLVIGAGGLGCPVLQYLAAAGIGKIGIVDFDKVSVSNLHRQVLYSTEDINLPKASVAAEKIASINPEIKVETYLVALTAENALSIFKPYDIVIDATDNYSARYIINDASEILSKPVVYGSIYKSEGQVAVFNLNNGPSYRCLFSEPPKVSANCSEAGVLGPLCGIIGSLMANETIKICIENRSNLNGELLLINDQTLDTTRIKFQRNKKTKITDMKTNEEYHGLILCDYNLSDEEEIDIETFKKLLETKTTLLDVRESWEQPKIHASNVIEIPLGDIENNYSIIPKDHSVIVFCHSGGRSKIAINQLKKEYGFSNLINLSQGIRML